MNHSEVETQAVAAAQLIANAAAKKPRTAVGLPSDSDRHYDLDELRACGFDAMAATIVHHIAYNTKRHKCAKAYTLPYWQSFFGGCSKQQARTAVKKALSARINDMPLLEISHGYFAKVWSPHYLYVGPGVEINTPSDADINTPSTEGNQQKVTKVKKDIEESGCKKPAATTIEKTSTQTGKDKPYTPKPGEVLHMAFRELQQVHELPFPEIGSTLYKRDCSSAEAIGHYLSLAELNEQQFAKWILNVSNWCDFDGLVQPCMDWSAEVSYPKLGYLRAHLFEALTLYVLYLDMQQEAAQALAVKFEQWAAEDAAKKAIAPAKNKSDLAQHVADKAAAKAIAETPEPQPEPAPAPNPEPLVVHYLTADDYEECNEPPLESEKAPLTPAELRALDHAKQQARIAALKQQKFAASAATMFHGKPKHVKAALTPQASFVGHAKG
ncbi:hypothetical protein PQQ87_24125 [Paraburkholderia nemoris]|uniref:hypothetical protein n=1 Tax=Paraburkholderia nemoris TaxID=2793076 RepID=UPI0038BA5C1D